MSDSPCQYAKESTSIESRELLFFSKIGEISKKISKSYDEKQVLVLHDGQELKNQAESKSISEFISSDIDINKYSVLAFTVRNSELLMQAFIKIFSFHGHVLALRTELHWEKKPLIIISPPKSGTHLLIKLVETFGYKEGGILPMKPESGKWYSLDNVSVHTKSHEYFRNKNIRGDLYGGRLNAFNACRGLVMYRHPRDVFKSALNYNFDPNNTVFGCYMEGFARKEKLKALLDPRSIAGDLGDVLNDMANWALFPNIVSVGYEEFNDSGRPNPDPVWQIQLLFHIEGDPKDYLSRSYGNSDTFREGKVFTPDEEIDSELDNIYNATSYYMSQLGYTKDKSSTIAFSNMRLRGVSTKDYRPIHMPIKVMLTESYLVWYVNGSFYACNKQFNEKICRALAFIDRSFFLKERTYESIKLRVSLYEGGTYFSRLLLRVLENLRKQKLLEKLISKVLR